MAHSTLTATRPAPRIRPGLTAHLQALGGLVDGSSPDPTRIFDYGLALLIHHLGVDRAIICRTTALGREVFWWATADGRGPDLAIQERVNEFCPRVLEHTEGVLVLQDAQREGSWNAPGAAKRLNIRGYLGVSLGLFGPVVGVLSLESGRARTFNLGEVAMVKAVASVFEKILEIEQLKHDLRLAQDSLDLTQAVVEDSLLEAPVSHLPNLRYLDVWTKASLFLARRSGESMALVRWSLPLTPASLQALQAVASTLRGEDLLVDLGKEEFLLLLPRSDQAGAEALLKQVRQKLGPVPMGATLWDPRHPLDRNDLDLHKSLKRAKVALQWSREATGEGIASRMGTLRHLLLEEFGVAWELLEAEPGQPGENRHDQDAPLSTAGPGCRPGDQGPQPGESHPAIPGCPKAPPAKSRAPAEPLAGWALING